MHLQVVNRYIDQGIAELVPGVLFIDEVRSCCSPNQTQPERVDSTVSCSCVRAPVLSTT